MSQHFPFRYSKTGLLIIRLMGYCFPAGAIQVRLRRYTCYVWGEFGCVGPLFTPQFQAQSNRRSYRVALIIERVGSGCDSNLMRVLIRLTAPLRVAKLNLRQTAPICLISIELPRFINTERGLPKITPIQE